MTVDRQMFAVVPAIGRAALSPAQKKLTVGKAFWLHLAHETRLPVTPTICITRAAWEALQKEKDSQGRLHRAWVATLFRLVKSGESPPTLAVRTSAARHSPGLARAKINIPAPTNEKEAGDPSYPLAFAVQKAFDSYAAFDPVWETPGKQTRKDAQIVLVQAMANGALTELLSRDVQTGALGPSDQTAQLLGAAAGAARELCLTLDAKAGEHVSCLVEYRGDTISLLSARSKQASAAATLEAGIDRVARGSWTTHQAVLSMDPGRIPQLLHPRLGANVSDMPIGMGVGVSPGAARGEIVFTSEDASRAKARGRHCILVAIETGPTDVEGMQAATGIVTARGGQNSHAAIIARVSGKPCVASVRSLQIDMERLVCRLGNSELREGDQITIDGTDGSIHQGALPLSQPHIGGAIEKLLDWSDASRTIGVRTNVETTESARTALSFGAEGIGLARSEHMFFSPERMMALRRMILSENEVDRRAALDGLVDFQRGDYAELFTVMQGLPVTVRLFDPPLHEFLPRTEDDLADTAFALNLNLSALKLRLSRLSETNPMLGHRGCRLAITYPEILEMQICALAAGVKNAQADGVSTIQLEVMVPFVSSPREVRWIKEKVYAIAEREGLFADNSVEFSFGTMIELPRAALTAGEIAKDVDFISFGTNDLTQTTFGISRDDAPVFLAAYMRRKIYEADPFVTIDQKGVGELIRLAIERGRSENPNLKVGICGEHAGDPASISFFASLGADYVSCSPYRVPIARLALAQSQRNAGKKGR